MGTERASGVILHPTSLPGPYGIGELGPHARAWVDFLVETGTSLWQILPLGPTGYGDSPYQCFSAFAGNPYLISLELLLEQGLLELSQLADEPEFSGERVDFGALIPWKLAKLDAAYRLFDTGQYSEMQAELEDFKARQAGWLGDYAVFMALKEAHGGAPWWEWEPALRARDSAALSEVQKKYAKEITRHEFYQFLFFSQWQDLRVYGNSLGVKIIGDIPIFVSRDSADVWANPGLFFLDRKGHPTVVSGVPPDYFSETGQLWGNPIYRWERHAEEGYSWWIERMKSVFSLVDIVRLDHFRGFAAYWEVPAAEETAVNGRWVPGPGADFFATIEKALGGLPIIAEDLGEITPDVIALREQFDLPGMQVLVFAFDSGPTNPFLPHHHRPDNVVYTGTHDNDTVIGWYQRIGENERDFFHRYLDRSGSEPNWDMIRTAWASVGMFAVAPMQDFLGLGNEARMNYPGRASGNWQWRMNPAALSPLLVERVARLNQTYERGFRPSVDDGLNLI